MCRDWNGRLPALRVLALVICSIILSVAQVSASHAAMNDPCGDLPESRLEIYDTKTPHLGELTVNAGASLHDL